ncbi:MULTISPECIES: hypothetical protein [unclassified Nonomuraea]|uniref:hypothetical protein n=1 Tax=unclassified Nonomuraea TaxID=2593643 RepID=UPI0033FC02BE
MAWNGLLKVLGERDSVAPQQFLKTALISEPAVTPPGRLGERVLLVAAGELMARVAKHCQNHVARQK